MWIYLIGAAQSAIFIVIVENNKSSWAIGFNVDLCSTIYGVNTLQTKSVIRLLQEYKNWSSNGIEVN